MEAALSPGGCLPLELYVERAASRRGAALDANMRATVYELFKWVGATGCSCSTCNCCSCLGCGVSSFQRGCSQIAYSRVQACTVPETLVWVAH